MTVRNQLTAICQNEDLNFLLTNRIPRRLATSFVGWLSKIERPIVRDVSLAIWRLFTDLDLSEAKTTTFRSMHDCFIRELKEGARPLDNDPQIIVSPSDGIVGAMGRVADATLFQIKGFPYNLRDLFDDDDFVETYRDGWYVTLRLTSGMYHRFHAPHDCVVEQVDYISGDTWNVNPIALRRVERLFCKNERAVVRTRIEATGDVLTLVPVAAILVASIRLNCLEGEPDLRRRTSRTTRCDRRYRKGEEMGWFEHGSTIVIFAPARLHPSETVTEGLSIKMGQPLFRAGVAQSVASSR